MKKVYAIQHIWASEAYSGASIWGIYEDPVKATKEFLEKEKELRKTYDDYEEQASELGYVELVKDKKYPTKNVATLILTTEKLQ